MEKNTFSSDRIRKESSHESEIPQPGRGAAVAGGGRGSIGHLLCNAVSGGALSGGLAAHAPVAGPPGSNAGRYPVLPDPGAGRGDDRGCEYLPASSWL